MYTEKNLAKEFHLSSRIKNDISPTSKKIIIMIIMLFGLLIPAQLVNRLVIERSYRQLEVEQEIGASWGEAQEFTGPILTIPYEVYENHYEIGHKDSSVRKTKRVLQRKEEIHLMPDELNIEGTLFPEEKSRGIFSAALYKTKLQVKSTFQPSVLASYFKKENVTIRYDKAFFTFGLTNMNGIKGDILITANNKRLTPVPGSSISGTIPKGLTIPVNGKQLQSNPITLNIELACNGSQSLSVIPIGQKNKISMKSTWQHPSFSGRYLPETREISEDGFFASWDIFNYDREIPPLFKSAIKNLSNSAIHVSLVQPVDGYQKVSRTTKYAILFILLTFVTFFMIEIKNKKPLHPIQYLLIGLAISIFYALLLSITEQTNFGIAYLAASSAVTLLITGYSHSVFKSHRVTMTVLGAFSTLYTILYIILQQEDKALLLGSISLFVALALVMFFTRDVDWYTIGSEKELPKPRVQEV